MTENTVRFYVTNVMIKRGASDRTRAVVNALRQGMIKLRSLTSAVSTLSFVLGS